MYQSIYIWKKTSTSRPQNLHHHLTWIQLQDLVSLIQILKWIYSACMSWSEKGQLTSERKQTTARDKTRSDHSSDIASLWTVTHQDGFCVWIRCCYVLTRCICPTIQLYLWEGRHTSHCICISRWCLSHIKMETKLEQIILLSEESFVFGIWVQEFDYLWGVICICDRLDLSALSVFASALVCHKSRCKIVLNVLFGWLHLKHLVVKGENCAGR